MEAAGVSVSHGAMGSLLGKLGDLLAGEYKLLKEAKDDVRFLRDELKIMQAFLERISDMENPDQQDKCWAKEVRELSYDIEDSVDEFMLRVPHESYSKPHDFKGFIKRIIDCVKGVTTRHKIAKELQGLKDRIKEVSERHKRYKIDGTVPEPNNTVIDPRMIALYTETTDLVGVEKSRDELTQLMMQEEGVDAQQLEVLAIWGFGGIGKTTLANVIYRKLERQFQCQSFVSVSQKPNILKIMRNILSQVGYGSPVEMDEDELVQALRRFLNNKRYLIVIDDLWDKKAWNVVRCAFPDSKNGSRVIATTRIEDVAIACCSNNSKYIYPMRPLSNEDSRILFLKRIFGSEDACPPYLNDVSTGILKRCGGLPLAVITISSLLATQRNKLRKEQWDHILNSLGSNLDGNSTYEDMMHILRLSYTNLPYYLKSCMLYLGIYPEDHMMDKMDLVKQWVAQGFIIKATGQDAEDIAENYFNELVNRSIIQPAQEFDHEEESYRVHDMMLDLIIRKCKEDNFVTTTNDMEETTRLSDKVRRLSLYSDDVKDGTTGGTIPLSQVRMLASFGASGYIPPLSRFKHLRVLTLVLSNSSHSDITDLTRICHLFLLRYLKFESCGHLKLPNKIQGLQHLETLDIGESLSLKVVLPLDIVHLPRLAHLIVPFLTILPDGIGHMKSLRTLQRIQLELCTIDNIRELGELTDLRDLEIRFDLPDEMDVMETRQRADALYSSLEHLSNLRFLVLRSLESFWWGGLSSLSSCPRLLRILCTFYLPSVPSWISELHNLRELFLGVGQVLGDDIRILAQLPSLIDLYLKIAGTARQERVVICREGFSILQRFQLSCIRVLPLTFQEGAMPSLQSLEIDFNVRGWERHGGGGAAPAGVEHLLALRKIAVRIGGLDAGESDRRAAVPAWRDVVDVHQGRPTAGVHCFDTLYGNVDLALLEEEVELEEMRQEQ